MLECINVLQTTHGNHRTLICAFLTSALISNLVKLDICALTCLTNSAICWLPPETSNVLVSLSRQSAYYSFLPKCRSFQFFPKSNFSNFDEFYRKNAPTLTTSNQFRYKSTMKYVYGLIIHLFGTLDINTFSINLLQKFDLGQS